MGNVFLFLVSVFLVFVSGASADNWYYGVRCYGDHGPCGYICGTCTAPNGGGYTRLNYSVGDVVSVTGYDRCVVTYNSNPPTESCYMVDYCSYSYIDMKCCKAGACPEGKVFSLDYCDCVTPPPPPDDTTFVCQNTGGPVSGGVYGSPSTASVFTCVIPGGGGEQVCNKTRELPGTCQDWNFCSEGVDDCVIPDSLGRPPCGRSGPAFTTSPRCYYSCANGSDLSCKPVSTQYVAGAVVAGECPQAVPEGCRPSSASSSASGGSSGSQGSSASGSNPEDWRDTVPASPGGSAPPEIDYTRILTAIHDTLHRANEQRDWQLQLDNNISLDLDNISNYTEYIYSTETSISSGVNGINSKLTSLQENGISLVSSTAFDLSDSRRLLDEINSYLHSDSLRSWPDTAYNPILRDIKGAIDSISVDVTVNGDSSGSAVDSSLLRWFGDYVQDTAARNGVLGKIWDNIKSDRDSVLSRNCTGFNECLAVYKRVDYCRQAWGVSTTDCVDGGSPFDNMLNVEASILSTIWDAIFGDDTTEFTPAPIDTGVSFSPAMSKAFEDVAAADSGLGLEFLNNIINSVSSLADSAKKAKKDSVEIQPDDLWLDSADAAKYVSTLLLPSGTGTDCFVCHADLGNFGGLSRDNLSIHIDFSNFGGYNWCEIARIVIKIATLVVCMSLTLGSWAAAFGYNPKNDA